MHRARLLATAACALLLSLGAASAQTDKPAEGAAPPPAAIQNAPPDKIAPSMKAGQPNAETHKELETTGQQPDAADAGKTRSLNKTAPDANGNVK